MNYQRIFKEKKWIFFIIFTSSIILHHITFKYQNKKNQNIY